VSEHKSTPRVCMVGEYYRNKAKERVFAHKNGLAVVKNGSFGTSLEVEKAKKCAAMLHLALLAVTAAPRYCIQKELDPQARVEFFKILGMGRGSPVVKTIFLGSV